MARTVVSLSSPLRSPARSRVALRAHNKPRAQYPNARRNAPRASTSSQQPQSAASTSAPASKPTKRAPRSSNASAGSAAGKAKQQSKKGKAPAEKKRKRAQEEEEELSEKKAGKRKVVGAVLPFSRSVSRRTVKKSWRSLSQLAQSSILADLSQESLDVLNALSLKDRASVQSIITRIESQIERELSRLVVPSSGFLSRPAGVAGSSREVELLEEEEMQQRILAWDHALVQENAGIQKLRKALKSERKALEEDEGRLAVFEDARLKVEQKEQRDSHKALNPLVAELMAKEEEPDELALGGELLAKKTPSNAWIAEAARVVDNTPLKGPDDDEIDDEEESAYSAAQDVYLLSLQARLAKPLDRIERSLEGVTRLGGALDQAERVVIGLI